MWVPWRPREGPVKVSDQMKRWQRSRGRQKRPQQLLLPPAVELPQQALLKLRMSLD